MQNAGETMNSIGRKSRKNDDAMSNLEQNRYPQTSYPLHLSCFTPSMVAASRAETVLLSSAGDVLQSRCRNSSPLKDTTTNWQDEFAMLCCEAQCDDIGRQIEDSALLCSPWGITNRSHPGRKDGLRGGAPAQIAPYYPDDVQLNRKAALDDSGVHPETPGKKKDKSSSTAQKAFRSPPLSDTGFDDDSIVPLKSFDYSHFADGGNDMLPPPNTSSAHGHETIAELAIPASRTDDSSRDSSERKVGLRQVFHGVPAFAYPFAQVKITQISANPFGSHTLLISNAGLLYSYGSNNYGQLGIGLKHRGGSPGYVSSPTIVTPLVENGGKTIACAAGVTHSLVVVATEVRRLIKSRPVNPAYKGQEDAIESVVHHQVYGFGRNDYMKIGLVSPKISKAGAEDEMDHVILPRRVALRCKVRQESYSRHDSNPPVGIFAVQASAEHSAALVRRGSGDVELYTWGNAMYGALGLPQATKGFDHRKPEAEQAVRVVPVPSFVAALSRSSNAHAKSSCLLLYGEYPSQIALGRQCSFVTTSIGRCFSFGVSEDGMLGLGSGVKEAYQPAEIALPPGLKDEKFVKVSAGRAHTVATTRTGKVFAWGSKMQSGLRGMDPTNRDGGEYQQWRPSLLCYPSPDPSLPDTMVPRTEGVAHLPESMVEAVCGYDNTLYVTSTGRVLSCGKASGRLGQGDVGEDVLIPRPLYGDLRLFSAVRARSKKKTPKKSKPPDMPARAVLRRGVTVN